MLDQLTDRAGTACLMMTLATFYPAYTFYLQLSMAIDITCHWLHLHTVTLQGKTSHKFIDMSENPIMHVYYTNKTVLFCMCAGNEAFYAAFYVMHFYPGPTSEYSCCLKFGRESNTKFELLKRSIILILYKVINTS